MRKISKITVTFTLIILSLSSYVYAQNKFIGIDDVQNRKYYPTRIYDCKFLGKSDSYSFTKDAQSLFVVKKAGKKTQTIAIGDITPKPQSLYGITYINDEEFAYLTENNQLYACNIKTLATRKLNSFSDQGTHSEINYKSFNIAYKENNNIYVSVGGNIHQLSTDGDSLNIIYGESVHRDEFGISKGFFWDENGDRLAFYRMDQSMVGNYPLVNTAEREAVVTPIKYPMAGMKSHEVLVGVYDIASGKTVYLQTRKDTSLAEREMYLTNVTFSPDGKIVYIAKLNRLQNHMWLESYNALSGEKLGVLFETTSPKYVEPQHPVYFVPNHADKFLWLSQRDGFMHIYLYNKEGKLLKQLTKGSWLVKSIEGFNAKGDEVYIYATKDSPIENNLYSVNINNGKISRITTIGGTHNVACNSNGTLFIDNYSNLTTPFVSQLIDNKGKTLSTLHKSDNPFKGLDAPSVTIDTFRTKDGTLLYSRIIKPANFDATKKYPAIVYVYGGPHEQLIENTWLGGVNNFFMYMASQDYIYWTVDSRGSSNRGYDFESALWHNCGSIEVSDQMEGVNRLKSFSFIDSTRIGVDGWSYGGFMTISLKLKNPGVFKVATAGGPVIDWKWYEIMYGERYMGTPQNNPEGFKNASLLNYVDNLQGKLLIMQGYQDNTVVPQHCIEFLKQCVRHDKQLDFFLYTEHPHNVGGKDRIHLYKKIYTYYKENL